MALPEIVLPKVEIPFDIPVLIHPITVHFLVAVPVIIVLLELMNLILKKRAIGGISFFLILLTVAAAAAAYLTGLNDAKIAFDTLDEAAKHDLSEHKLLGIYVMLASGVILLLKVFAMTGNKLLKALYIFMLFVFIGLLFKQGEEGGELVYEHGVNVEKVQDLSDENIDLKESLEEALSKRKTETTVSDIKVKTEDNLSKMTTQEVATEAVSTPSLEENTTSIPTKAVPEVPVSTAVDTVSSEDGLSVSQ